MKKQYMHMTFALCVAALLAGCGKKQAETPAPQPVQTAPQPTISALPAPTPAPAPEVPAKKEVRGPATVYPIASAFQGQDAVDQCYNAREWKKGFSLKEIVEDNFWWQPGAETVFSTGTLGDPYLDSAPYAKGASRLVVDKYVTFMKDDESQKFDVFTGKGQSATYDCNYKVYMVDGPEALIFVPFEEIALESLFDMNENMYLSGANSYDIYDVDGTRTTIDENAFCEGKLVKTAPDKIDAVFGRMVVENVRDIAVGGMSSSLEPLDEGIAHLVIAQNAKGVYGKEAPYLGNVAGAYYEGYVLGTLASRYGLAPTTVTVTSEAGDETFAASEIADRRLMYLKKSDSYALLKEHQIKGESGDALMGVSKVVAGDAAFVVAAGDASLADLLSASGTQGNDFEVTALDGSVKTVADGDLASVKVSDVKSVTMVD
ncbi:MAG: hypothetical protein SPF89_05105 [Sphaerochaetaceae bacterium]|nr:hypothetical protein [Spirochaetales bacterium]MDY5499464.1 hypothetical protein [Sphaerochaetaceae bacterium]